MNWDRSDSMDYRSVEFDSLSSDFIEWYNRRLELDLRGAWMAGFDRLDVYSGVFCGPLGRALIEDTMTTEYRSVPRYEGQRRDDPPGFEYHHSYDIAAVPDGIMKAALGGDVRPEDVDL